MTTPTSPASPASPTAPAGPVAPTGHEQLFPQHIGDPNADNYAPASPTEPGGSDAQIAELRQQLEQQQQQWNEREQFYRQSLDTLMQQRSAPMAPTAPAAPPELPGFDDLPDPVQNPKDYNAALAQRIQAREQALVANLQQNVLGEVSRAQALDSLWNRFSAAQPELSKRQALLQGAAAVTFNELRARGVDPVTVASQNPDSLINAIAQRMQAEIVTAGEPGPAAPGAGAARTQGLAAGSTPTAPTAPAAPQLPSFDEQIKENQRKMGLI